MKYFKHLIFIILALYIGLFSAREINAAYSTDSTNAIYTDDFATNGGVPTRSYLNTTGGFLQLTNAVGQTSFTTPLAVGGSAITGVIKPIQIAKWGILSIAATIPANTTLKVQILDDGNTPWQDSYLPGNSVGVAVSDSLDLSNIPVITCADGDICNKPYAMKIRFIMSTGDTGITPKINSISLTWTKNQGDLSATVYDSGPWSSTYGNKERTVSSPYSNSSVYPAFKWASEKYVGDLYYSSMFVDTDKIIGHVDNNYDYFFARNRDTGEQLWKIPCGYVGDQGLIAANNTFYGADMLGDAAYAVDTTSGLVKWVYDFTAGGHGTDGVLGSDGTLYVLRNMTVGNTGSLYALNPDGSLKSRFFLTLFDVPTEAFSFGEMAVGNSDVAYFTTATYNESTYENTNHGKLTAINLSTGTSLWSYSSGNLNGYFPPIIGPDGTIYVTTENQFDELPFIHTIFAINSNGSLKWRRDTTNEGQGYFSLSLRSDGVLLTQSSVSSTYDDPYKLEAIQSSDGSLFWSKDISDFSIPFSFSDGNNGVYYADMISSGVTHGKYTRMNYLDSLGNSKWSLKYPYVYDIEAGKRIYYNLEIIRPDERGWLYGGFTKSVSDNSTYDRLPLETWNQTYALAPWTMTHSDNIGSTIPPGASVSFIVTTSMGVTNPLFGGDNQVQIYLDTGATFPLTYSSTDGNGNTIWTGTYSLPGNISSGTHTYTVEASQPYVQTDISTHFSSAPIESNNTGIIATDSFSVSALIFPLGVGITLDIQTLANMNILTLSIGDSPSSVDSLNVNNNLNFQVGNNTVLLPAGSVISSTNNLPFNSTQIQSSTLPPTSLNSIFPDAQIGGVLQWGIPNLGLQFSQPLTLSIFVGSQYNGQTLTLLRSINGLNFWTSDGFISPNSCVITNGYCTFQTTKASYFVVKTFDTPVVNNSPSNSNSSPSCDGPKPLTAPDLFQINVNNTTAKLFFTPISNTNNYHISFSTKSTAQDYDVDVVLAREGVQNYTVEQLKPSTTYYFKIRGKNGCTFGDWSNTFKITTRSKNTKKITSFFKKNQSKIINVTSTAVKKAVSSLKKITPPKDSLLNPQSNPPLIDTPRTQTNTPVTPQTTTPAPKKKTCILWWCF